jgi:GDSL-like Lipase/Acylhydrolase family
MRGSRRATYVVSTLVVIVVATAITTVLRANAAAPRPAGFYLDIGASSSRGFEPSGKPGLKGAPTYGVATPRGYSDDLVALEAPRVTLSLLEIGCPGETSLTMVGFQDHCYKLPTTQMTLAQQFLAAHQRDLGVVTIDIGFNDLRPCISQPRVDVTCADQALHNVRVNMPKVLDKLKSAAGPLVHFVGFTYGDPLLAHYLNGAAGRKDAARTLSEMSELNTVLAAAYTHAGIAHIDLPSALKSFDTRPTRLHGGQVVPKDVEEICATTWMCRTPPWGPDDHPNDMGYRIIARAIAQELPSSW